MQSSSKRALGLIVVLVLILVGLAALRQPPVPDQDQIAAQLESARAAAEAHDSGGIMRIISADFKGPGYISNVDSLHFALGRALNQSGRIRVTFSPPSVAVQGGTATSTCQWTIRDRTGQTLVDQPVTLHWRREDGRRLLILPAKVWRVVGTDYQGPLPDEDG